jgi:cell division FtsZ-interacting protein ZapD
MLRDKIEHKIQLVKEFKNQKNKYQIWYENQIKSNDKDNIEGKKSIKKR